MSKHRNRIERLDQVSHLSRMAWHTPRGAQALGYIRRGDDEGRLLRLSSGAYVIQYPGGAIGTLDQRKVQALLDQEPGHAAP